MIKNRIPTTRKTITLPDVIWAEIETYQQKHQIRAITETVERLIKAGLTVKVAVVGLKAKRKSI